MLRSLARTLVFILIVGAAAAIFMAGCGDGDNPAAETSSLAGTVTDDAGSPLAGVTVDLPSSAATGSTVTLANGTYRLGPAPVGSDIAVRFAKANYVTVVRTTELTGGNLCAVDASLRAVGNAVQIDPAAPVTVADNRADGLNANVEFPANAFDRVTPTAKVEITTAVPSDPNYAESFPGQFIGAPAAGGEALPLESFGIVCINVTDPAGDKLQLAGGKKATITVPVDPAHDPGLPTVPLWRLDPDTGIWAEIGVLTRVAGPPAVYTAEVDHLSDFNVDIARPKMGLKVIAVDYADKPNLINFEYPDNPPAATEVKGLPRIPGVWVVVKRETWAGSGTTNGQGVLSLSPPEGYSVTHVTGSRSGYADSRVFAYEHDNQGTAIVWVGLRRVPGAAVGDVGAVVN